MQLRAVIRESARRLRLLIGKTRPVVCLAYSGGLDSAVLLDILANEHRIGAFDLSAIHVHHGLSPNADRWAAHCESVCRTLGIAIRVVRVRVDRVAGRSVEELAREARYRAFAGFAADAIALAHHANDQAETILLQLLRGAGPKGIAAMAPLGAAKPRADLPQLWRPLLGATRADLAAYARRWQLRWVEDESNQDPGFRRNFLRHRVFPVLDQSFPKSVHLLARAAALQAETVDLLDEVADADLASLACAGGLDCKALLALSPARQANALRRWIARAGLRAPSAARLSALLVAIGESGNDTRLTWDHAGMRIRRCRAVLTLDPVATATKRDK